MNEHIYCIIISISYVITLYFIPIHIRKLPRDHPIHVTHISTITARIICSCSTTLVSLFSVYWFDLCDNISQNHSYIDIFGFSLTNSIKIMINTIILMIIFYLGPVITQICYYYTSLHHNITMNGKLIKRKDRLDMKGLLQLVRERNIYPSIIIIRNLLIAPLTEEIVFRGLLVPLVYNQYINVNTNYSNTFLCMLICPLYFGLAHIHHMIELLYSGESILSTVLTTLLQLIYTSIFGCIAVYLFMRSGSIVSPLVSHIICNFQGLPDIGFININNELSFLFPYRIILLLLHGIGLILFVYSANYLTQSLTDNSIYYKQI